MFAPGKHSAAKLQVSQAEDDVPHCPEAGVRRAERLHHAAEQELSGLLEKRVCVAAVVLEDYRGQLIHPRQAGESARTVPSPRVLDERICRADRDPEGLVAGLQKGVKVVRLRGVHMKI